VAILLFSLRGVPEDEVDEINALLTEQNVDFYETPAGNWGISMPALWLRDHNDQERARQLLANYQAQRLFNARAAYLQRQQTGEHKTLLKAFMARPLQHGAYWLASGLVCYVSIKWLLELGAAN
jgi:hypothetical protein